MRSAKKTETVLAVKRELRSTYRSRSADRLVFHRHLKTFLT